MERYYDEKDPDSLLDYSISWDTWLQANESIITHVWTVPTGITKTQQTDGARLSTVWLSGGSINTNYTINLHITTNLGRQEDRELIVIVSPIIRLGLIPILLDLRSLTSTSLGDTTINEIPYWTDAQLQRYLSMYATTYIDEQLLPFPQLEASTLKYYTYVLPPSITGAVEQGSAFIVVDKNGTIVTNYAIDHTASSIVFDADTAGAVYYLRCISYDMRLAAARVWLEKASHRAELIDWKAGGQTFNEDQEYQHCIQQAERFAGSRGIAGLLQRTGSNTVRLRKEGYGAQDRRSKNDYAYSPNSNTEPYA